MKKICLLLGFLWSFLYPTGLHKLVISCRDYFYTGWRYRKFKRFDSKSRICCGCYFCGEHMIEIGSNVFISNGTVMTAQTTNKNEGKTLICIGDGSFIGKNNHLTAASGVFIGKNLMTGPNVLITDNAHGNPQDDVIKQTSPRVRPVYSKGPVRIGDNVWIGEGVAIMAKVVIGDGAIIGANSVVTHDVEPYSIYAGNPARKIN